MSLRTGTDLTRNIRCEGLSRDYLRGDDESWGPRDDQNTPRKVPIDKASSTTPYWTEAPVCMVFGLETFAVHLSALRVDGQRGKGFPE